MHPTVSLLALVALGASVTAFVPSFLRDGESAARKELAARGISIETAALVTALASGDRETARLLLHGGLSPTKSDAQGRTPLMLVLGAGMPELAEELLEKGADPGAIDREGHGVLEYAVRAGEVSIVSELLHRGMDPNPTLPGGGSLVGEATRLGRLASAKLLLEAGASTWGCGADDQPLIVHATLAGADWMVERLLARGVSATGLDANGDSLLHAAMRRGNQRLMSLFRAHGVDPEERNKAGETALQTAVLEGRSDALSWLLEQGAAVETAHPTGWSPLQLALQRGDLSSMRILLDHGADPNAKGARGRTTMDLVVALESKPEALRMLLEAGADAGARGPDGRTAFDMFLAKRDFASARLLLEHGATPTTSLSNAVVEGDEEVFDFLLKNGADPNGTSTDPPLVGAVRHGQPGMVARLLEAGAALDSPGEEGQSALHLAVVMDRADLATLLLKAGADPNVPYAEPVSAEFLKKVREVGYIKWQFQRDRGITPLMVAADSGNHALARVLLDHGARRNVWTKRKAYYPVGFAARREDVKMMQLMLGRDPDHEERLIKVDLSEQKAYVFGKNGEEVFSTKVSTGKSGFRTRTGEFVITNKERHHESSIYESASMPYFQRLSCGDFGFHEGYCPGYAASHGCIRVPKGNVVTLWKLTEPGDRVVIVP